MNPRLKAMLEYKRPHATLTELDWAEKFIMPYAPEMVGDKDTMAYIVMINRLDGAMPNVLFSSHVDTVHRDEGKQKVKFDGQFAFKKDGDPLGADDAAGCWIMLEMIDRQIPGAYVFHRGEERGGIGSKWMARNNAEWLRKFDYAVAFDRRATHSVITHQGRGRCCSDEFAEALADALNLNSDDFMYAPDDTGIYTDTAEYTDLIAECTNLSCGYYDEHTGKEKLDVVHLERLRDACLSVQWEQLPVSRQPGDDDYDYDFGYDIYGLDHDLMDDAQAFGELISMRRGDMVAWAASDPESFADLVFEAVADMEYLLREMEKKASKKPPKTPVTKYSATEKYSSLEKEKSSPSWGRSIIDDDIEYDPNEYWRQ